MRDSSTRCFIASILLLTSVAANGNGVLQCRITRADTFSSDSPTLTFNCGQADPQLDAEESGFKVHYCESFQFDPSGRRFKLNANGTKYERSYIGRAETTETIDRVTGSYFKLIKRSDGSRTEVMGICSPFTPKF